jgi:hypothetical protein
MKKLIVVVMVAIMALGGCVQIAVPTEAPTNTSEPTKESGASEAQYPNIIASDFLYAVGDLFLYYEQIYKDPPVALELVRLAFEYVNDDELYLVMETKSSVTLIQDKTALIDSIATLSAVLVDDWKLPKDITGIWFVNANNNLVIQEMYYLEWGVMLDYVDGNIDEEELLLKLQTPDEVPLLNNSNSY